MGGAGEYSAAGRGGAALLALGPPGRAARRPLRAWSTSSPRATPTTIAAGRARAAAPPIRARPTSPSQSYRLALAAAPRDLQALSRLLRAFNFRGAFCGADVEARSGSSRRARRSARPRSIAWRSGEGPAARRAHRRPARDPRRRRRYYWTAACWGQWAGPAASSPPRAPASPAACATWRRRWWPSIPRWRKAAAIASSAACTTSPRASRSSPAGCPRTRPSTSCASRTPSVPPTR